MISAVSQRAAVAVAALAGAGLAAGIMLVQTDGERPNAGRQERTAQTASIPEPSRVPTTSTTAPTTGSAGGGSTTTPVTVDVPRSERGTAADVYQPPASPDTAPEAPVESITDPQEAATAYLIAAETVTGEDTGRRHRRAEPYMDPTNPETGAGLLVTDPPPAGYSRTIEIVAITEWARNEDGDRIAYEVTYQPRLSPIDPAGPALPEVPERVTYVAVALQSDGRWLVTTHAASLDPVE